MCHGNRSLGESSAFIETCGIDARMASSLYFHRPPSIQTKRKKGCMQQTTTRLTTASESAIVRDRRPTATSVQPSTSTTRTAALTAYSVASIGKVYSVWSTAPLRLSRAMTSAWYR